MIFEEEVWLDDDTGKSLEASLFRKWKKLKKQPRSSAAFRNKAEAKKHDLKKDAKTVSTCEKASSKIDVQSTILMQKRTAGTSKNAECKPSTEQFVNLPVSTASCETVAAKPVKPTDGEMLVTTLTGKKKLPRKKKNLHKGTSKSAMQKIDLISSATKPIDSKDESNEKILVAKSQTKVEKVSNSVTWRKRALSKLIAEGAPSEKKPRTKDPPKRPSSDDLASTEKSKLGGSKTAISTPPSRSKALNQAVTAKLRSAQFRFINEQLYTRTSKEAIKLFGKEKKLFGIYHDGFTQQVSKWPTNPLDTIINYISKKPAGWIIGDFGCGDARLARSVRNKVHSFDLVATNDKVTVADIAHVPLPNQSLDVAVLCLALMGTNYVDFIAEANRTLKLKGTLLIAEIESRFKNITKFKNLMKNMGFQLKKEEKNTYFLSFTFMKHKSPNKEIKAAIGLLQPCVYKKR